jgi:hypothetical protein
MVSQVTLLVDAGATKSLPSLTMCHQHVHSALQNLNV